MTTNEQDAMSGKSPIVSIVITTKNRARTAIEVIETILRFEEVDFELVVQDCSDNDQLDRHIATLPADPRLRYQHTAPVSMTDNWNRAVDRSQGQYVVIIGDDDMVLPEIVHAARWAAAEDLDAVSYTWSSYHWSDFPDRHLAGKLRMGRVTGAVTWHDAPTELTRACDGYGADIERVPHIYHGLVRRRLLDDLRKRSGAYFDSICPDYYGAFAVAALAGRFPRFELPLSIMGHSGSSNTARGRSRAERRKSPHLREYGQRTGEPWLPIQLTTQMTLAEALLKALRNTDRLELASRMELSRVYASTFADFPEDTFAILRRYEQMRQVRRMRRTRAYSRLGIALTGKVLTRVRDRVMHAFPLRSDSSSAGTIGDALEAVRAAVGAVDTVPFAVRRSTSAPQDQRRSLE